MRTVLALLLLAGTAQAGLYNLNDPAPRFFKSLAEVRSHVKDLRGLTVPLKPGQKPDQGSLRVLYPQQAERLEALLKDGTITTLERVDLSACYVRMGKQKEALEALEGADQDHFLVQANLAVAHMMGPEVNLRQAAICQGRVLALWPKASVFWNSDDLELLRQCEQAQMRLIDSRLAESRLEKQPSPVPLDNIFPGFRVEGPKGYYIPEGLPETVRDRLPLNAGLIMTRLVRWLPNDRRLYWQYGEMLAMLGQVKEAAEVLDELVWDGGAFENLREHRKIVGAQANLLKELEQPKARWALVSVGHLLGVPYQPAGNGVAGLFQALTATQLAPLAARGGAPQPVPDDPLPPGPAYPFNVQHVTVAFLFGIIVAVLLSLQWMEWRRQAQAAPQDPVSVPVEQQPPAPSPPRGPDGIKSN
jgi:hypothetical protein